jgi:hypothetical protein
LIPVEQRQDASGEAVIVFGRDGSGPCGGIRREAEHRCCLVSVARCGARADVVRPIRLALELIDEPMAEINEVKPDLNFGSLRERSTSAPVELFEFLQ